MFAPYYIHPIFVVGAGYISQTTYSPPPSSEYDDLIFLAWYYMVNYA